MARCMRRRRPEAVPLVTLPPVTVLPSIVKVVPGLKGGELFDPCGVGVTMVVKVPPTRPGAVALLLWARRRRPVVDPVEQVPPSAPTALPARPM
jgi:hypothetical protein